MPAAVGEPEIVPLAESESPAGSAPDAIDQERGAVPPSALPARTGQTATYELASAAASPETTASIGPSTSPWSAVADVDTDDHRMDAALAYAAPSHGTLDTKPPAARAAPMGSSTSRATASFGAIGATTILQKSLASLPLRKPAPPTPPDQPSTFVPTFGSAQSGVEFDDPWLRALVLAPNLKSYMTVTSFEAPDFRELQPMMEKPALSIKMTFSVDPNTVPTSDRFSGSAVVFLSTVNFMTRTASLQ